MQAVLDQAIPMVRLLWRRETEGKVFDSPERKAALDKALREKIKLIRDPSIRQHYGEDIKEMRWQLFRGGREAPSQGKFSTWQGGGKGKGRGGWRNRNAPTTPMPGTKSSLLAAAGDEATVQMREAVILASAIATPAVIVEFRKSVRKHGLR